VVSMATGDASRFSQLATAYEKAPNVTRERLYIEAVESVLKSSRKVIIDSKGGNGNMLYLPLDKLLDRRDSDGGTVTVRPPVAVEPDPSSAADPRTRVER
jgi:membrane protease subunit HflK